MQEKVNEPTPIKHIHIVLDEFLHTKLKTQASACKMTLKDFILAKLRA